MTTFHYDGGERPPKRTLTLVTPSGTVRVVLSGREDGEVGVLVDDPAGIASVEDITPRPLSSGHRRAAVRRRGPAQQELGPPPQPELGEEA